MCGSGNIDVRLVCLSRAVDSRNGWGRVAYEILKQLVERRVEVVVFSVAGSTNRAIDGVTLRTELRPDGQRIFKPLDAVRDVVTVGRAAAGADAIVAFDEPGVLAADMLARRWKIPFLAILHGTYAVTTLQGRMGGRLHRRAYNRAGALLFVSGYTRKRFQAAFPEHRAPRKLLPLGVDPSMVVDAPPGFHARQRELLTVGEVKPRKGLLQTVEALVRVPESRRPRIVVAGAQSPDNDYVKRVNDRAVALGVRDRLSYLGRVSDDELEQLYRRAVAFVLPSQNVGNHFEGFGLVHLEAAARGLPAIGCRDCGNEDSIRDGITGHLCAQQDAEELAACIDRLASDAAHWSACSGQAVEWAKSMPWSRTSDTLIEAVEAIRSCRA